MKNLILFAFVLLTLTFFGCKTKKEFVYMPGQTITSTDTVTITKKVVERDTIIIKAASEVGATIPLKDIKTGFKSHFNNKDASGSVEEKEGNLNIVCKCDSLAIAVKLKDQIINTLEKRLKTTDTLHPVQYTPGFIKILAWVGGILLALIIAVVILKKLKILK